uniref:DDE_Tnp_1_7 domain-containing protein n=1 Tax=Glossina austeni TaxID=7395 RepID=A0A1A9UYQ9_GLOAU
MVCILNIMQLLSAPTAQKDKLLMKRFDNKNQRSQRLQNDKFALISDVWYKLMGNSQNCYKPGAYLAIDEQLFPTKERCRFTQYRPNKADNFGIKFWLASDVNLAGINAGILYKETTGEEISRQEFLFQLAEELKTEYQKKKQISKECSSKTIINTNNVPSERRSCQIISGSADGVVNVSFAVTPSICKSLTLNLCHSGNVEYETKQQRTWQVQSVSRHKYE